MKTTITKPADVERTWYVVDAEGQTLGIRCIIVIRGIPAG